MNFKNYAALSGIICAVAVVGAKLHHPNESKRMQREVDEVNATLPKNVDMITTHTRVELSDHTITYYYSISQAMSNDASVTETLRQGLLQRTCAKAESRKLLSMGYALASVFTVLTPHGPGQIRVLIAPADCG
jgi:hypothetical protein